MTLMQRNLAKMGHVRQNQPKGEAAEEITLEAFKRSKLDVIAEKLKLNPEDYSNVAKIAAAIRAAAKAQGKDLSDLI